MRFFILICSLFLCTSLMGQKLKEKEVPEKVVRALYKQFKSTRKVNWMGMDSLYRAEFEFEGKPGFALFTEKGRFVESGVAIPESELLFSIGHYIRRNYPDDIISAAFKTKNALKVVQYIIGVGDDTLIFDDLGHLVSKETKPEVQTPPAEDQGYHRE